MPSKSKATARQRKFNRQSKYTPELKIEYSAKELKKSVSLLRNHLSRVKRWKARRAGGE